MCRSGIKTLARHIQEIIGMPMKTNRILCLCAAIMFPQLALAELPFTDQSLGTAQATVDFCAQIDPGTATKYQQQVTLLVQGVSEDEVAKIRSTDDYKDAYARASAALAEVSKPDAAEACNRFLETDRQD